MSTRKLLSPGRGTHRILSTSRNSVSEVNPDEQCSAALRAAGVQLGLGHIEFDAEHSCLLKFDEVLLSLHAPAGHFMFITTALFMLRRPVNAETMANLLAANLHRNQSADATLAYHAQTSAVLLQDRIIKQDLARDLLLDRIDAIVEAAERWRDRLPLDQIIPLESDAIAAASDRR